MVEVIRGFLNTFLGVEGWKLVTKNVALQALEHAKSAPKKMSDLGVYSEKENYLVR